MHTGGKLFTQERRKGDKRYVILTWHACSAEQREYSNGRCTPRTLWKSRSNRIARRSRRGETRSFGRVARPRVYVRARCLPLPGEGEITREAFDLNDEPPTAACLSSSSSTLIFSSSSMDLIIEPRKLSNASTDWHLGFAFARPIPAIIR